MRFILWENYIITPVEEVIFGNEMLAANQLVLRGTENLLTLRAGMTQNIARPTAKS